MTINTITGRAKKFDGSAIDYVSIFNWSDGKCIAQVTPDSAGNWEYEYNKELNVGLTYVADGCEPVTHGSYYFSYESTVPNDYILSYSFNGDVLDGSTSNLNGIRSGNANFVVGRKNGTQALEFIAGCVRTPQALPINSDKVTISFWMNTLNNNTSFIYELSSNYGANNNAFACYIEASDPNKIRSYVGASGNNNAVSAPITKNGVWQHVIIEIDRSRDIANEQKVYINNVQSNLTFIYSTNTSGNFGDYIFYIGQRNASNFPYVGKLQDFKVYNRLLTNDERTALFDE